MSDSRIGAFEVMKEIEFTFRKVTAGIAFDAGANGILSTTGMLTAEQRERLREFWKSPERAKLRDGDKFRMPFYLAPTAAEDAA
jgi:hypothetical protein